MTRPPTEAALPGARRLGLGPSATNEKILKNEPAFAAVKRARRHRRHSIWWSGGGPASARTSMYSAAQFGQ